ncbi:MAG: hypothetical protein WCL02_02255 [bacterium]
MQNAKKAETIANNNYKKSTNKTEAKATLDSARSALKDAKTAEAAAAKKLKEAKKTLSTVK